MVHAMAASDVNLNKSMSLCHFFWWSVWKQARCQNITVCDHKVIFMEQNHIKLLSWGCSWSESLLKTEDQQVFPEFSPLSHGAAPNTLKESKFKICESHPRHTTFRKEIHKQLMPLLIKRSDLIQVRNFPFSSYRTGLTTQKMPVLDSQHLSKWCLISNTHFWEISQTRQATKLTVSSIEADAQNLG